jgi:hypothetical protein
MRNVMMDAQVAMSFAVSQATRINPVVYRVRYPAIRYRGLVPVNTEGPEWIPSVTYFSLDGAGQAEWFSAGGDDVPKVALLRDKKETPVAMAAIGYGWNLEELGRAQQLGINLGTEKAQVARRVSEEKIDAVAFTGDAVKGFSGVVNNPGVTAGSAPATGTGSSTEWQSKSPGQILLDINTTLTGIWTGSNTVEMADTLLLPEAELIYIGTTMINDHTETTILDWVKQNNAYTLQTGQPLTIRGVRGLETAGAGGTSRMVAYRNSNEVLELYMPMPFRFFPVWQTGPMRYDVPGAFRIGGVDVKLPSAIRYLDGI